MRPTEAVIDLAAVARNVERLVEHAAPAQVCAVTKADAYGHGSVACAQVALEAGASCVAVALVEEGVELRHSGIDAPILLLSEPRPEEMVEVVEAGLSPTVYSSIGLDALLGAVAAVRPAPFIDVHLNLDTGMNRVGLRPRAPLATAESSNYALDAVRAIHVGAGVRLAGVWTHLAVADELDRPETATQLARFRRLLDDLADEIGDDVIIHAANSAGFLAHPESHFDLVRIGIATYGIEPAPGIGAELGLEPAMTLRSQLSMVKPVFAGESVSYGLAHTFGSDTIIGTVPMGYADGLRRDASARGADVLVGGKRRPIVGVVTMDQAMVDLGPGSTHRAGDEVTIIGPQADDEISVTEIAQLLDTIPYEIICDIGRRVRRRYV